MFRRNNSTTHIQHISNILQGKEGYSKRDKVVKGDGKFSCCTSFDKSGDGKGCYVNQNSNAAKKVFLLTSLNDNCDEIIKNCQ